MPKRTAAPLVRLEPWSAADLDLLRRINAPEMMEHLGGPETDTQVVARQRRYVELGGTGTGRMFRIVLLPRGEGVGSIGYWERAWQGETVWEAGWSVLSPYQGRGIAGAALAAVVASAAAEHRHRYVHAFPSVDNPASNALCRRLGFSFIGEYDSEYPPGRPMRCNDWRLGLAPAP